MKWYLNILTEGFKGRIGRTEYLCFLILITLALYLLAAFDRFILWQLLKNDLGSYDLFELEFFSGVGYSWSLLVLTHTMPIIGASVRRMHDINKSGWYLLIPIYNLILIFSKGSEDEDKKKENKKVNFRLFTFILVIILLLTWFFESGFDGLFNLR